MSWPPGEPSSDFNSHTGHKNTDFTEFTQKSHKANTDTNKQQQQQTLGREENLISTGATFGSVKSPVFNQTIQESMAHTQRAKKAVNKNCPWALDS